MTHCTSPPAVAICAKGRDTWDVRNPAIGGGIALLPLANAAEGDEAFAPSGTRLRHLARDGGRDASMVLGESVGAVVAFSA